MMGSILNRKKSARKESIASLSIEMLPEYGWSTGDNNNERAFGPGTLFRGYVVVKCRELSERASRLHILFQGSESMLTYDIGLGAMRSNKVQFFKVHSTLWKKTDELDVLKVMQTYKFLFTIQMPMIQFPPSMHHDFYKCTFKLSAYLYTSQEYGKIPIIAQRFIKYIPLIETKLLKAPIYLQNFKKKKEDINSGTLVFVQLFATEYVLGDTIQAVVHFERKFNTIFTSNNTIASISDINALRIVLSLYQISKFNIDDEPISEKLVETQTHNIKADSSEIGQYKVSLKVNELLPPTFGYGKIMCASYKLKIKVYLKRTKSSNTKNVVSKSNGNSIDNLSEDCVQYNDNKKLGLKKYLVLPWFSSVSTFESPIVIGTMVRGIRADDELKEYSSLSSRSSRSSYVPNFIPTVENEDTLPRYEDTRLPSYNDCFNTNGMLLMTVVAP